jgi:UTP--glucose-1-phosphate uridylyltransferase
MVEAYAEKGGNILAVMDVPRDQTSRYGVLNPGREDGRLVEVKGLIEKPKPAEAPSTACVIGRYILQPEIFKELDRQDVGAGNEIQLTDAMARLIGWQPFHGLRFQGRRFDCGDKAGFIEATIAYALDHADIGGEAKQMLLRFAHELKSVDAA